MKRTAMFALDQHLSILMTRGIQSDGPFCYTLYGGLWPSIDLLLAYNGERLDPVTESYPLGNGYRNYSPRIMRFTSPDGLSPFGKGGRNAYAYCEADPMNNVDPSGHSIVGILMQFHRFTAWVAGALGYRAITSGINPSAVSYGALSIAAAAAAEIADVNPLTQTTLRAVAVVSGALAKYNENVVPTIREDFGRIRDTMAAAAPVAEQLGQSMRAVRDVMG